MADRLLTTSSHQDNERLRQPNTEQALAILVDINSRVEAIQTATTQINKDLAKLRDSLSPQPTSEPDNRPECPIDLEPINPEDAEALPCGHVFHSACIATWLRQSNTCPVDRSRILNGNEQLQQQQQQQEPPYELSADPLQITIPGAFPSSDTAELLRRIRQCFSRRDDLLFHGRFPFAFPCSHHKPASIHPACSSERHRLLLFVYTTRFPFRKSGQLLILTECDITLNSSRFAFPGS
ncbi:hypothetical protein KC362_g3 [Hortaea werneckii]|nr:hypothetical protein KC362_g3 [Hortaea werneckii]